MRERLFADSVAQVSNLLYRRLPVGKPLLLAALLAMASGCGDPDHSHEADEANAAPKVCGYKEGYGVFVSEQTRAAIRLQVAEVVMKSGDARAAVPESSLLSTATGDFVFAVNGDHFQRTPIKTAGLADGWIAVVDGLVEGDQVVTSGVRELWRIELQATKTGAACAH